MTTNDKLREALEALDSEEPAVQRMAACRAILREALAASKPEPQVKYTPSYACQHDEETHCTNCYAKPQAQAGEPEVHVTMDDAIAAGDGTLHGAIEYWQNRCAKKDAALKACVIALRIADKFCGEHTPESCPDTVALPIKDAITQAEEAMK